MYKDHHTGLTSYLKALKLAHSYLICSKILSNFVQIFPFPQVTWGCYFHRIYWYLFPYKGFWQFHPMDLVTRWCYWCWNIHPWTYDDHCFWFPFSVWCWLKSSSQTYQTYWEDPQLQCSLTACIQQCKCLNFLIWITVFNSYWYNTHADYLDKVGCYTTNTWTTTVKSWLISISAIIAGFAHLIKFKFK